MTALCNNSEDEAHWRFPPAHSNLIHGCPQVILPARRRRRRRRRGSPRWMRLCRCTGGTVMRRCTPAATSTRAAESTCWSLTTPIHSGAPRVSTTESTTPDKPEYRHWGSQGVCMFMYVCVCVCRWRFLWWQPVWVCVCLCVPCACEGESDTRSILDKNHQRVTKRHIWSPTLEIGLICVYCMCMRVPRYTHAIMLVIEPVEEECVFPLYIHRLSLLRSHRPSCRTLLSYCISPLFTLGSSSVTTPARHCPTWPCGCFCPEWRFFFFVNGNLQRVPHSCEPTVSCYCRW